MNEDAQPNEHALIRKGGPVPVIWSQRARALSFRHSGHSQSSTRGRPRFHPASNPPSSATQHPATTRSYGQYVHQSTPPRSNLYAGPPPQRRRQTDNVSRHVPHVAYKQSLTPRHRRIPSNKGKGPERKAEKESTELLLDIPPECQKGSPNSQLTRKRWQEIQARELSASIGVPLRFGGYLDGCARFVLDEKPLALDLGEDVHGKRSTFIPLPLVVVEEPSLATPDHLSQLTNTSSTTGSRWQIDEEIMGDSFDDPESPYEASRANEPTPPRASVPTEKFPSIEPYSAPQSYRVFRSGVICLSPSASPPPITEESHAPVYPPVDNSRKSPRSKYPASLPGMDLNMALPPLPSDTGSACGPTVTPPSDHSTWARNSDLYHDVMDINSQTHEPSRPLAQHKLVIQDGPFQISLSQDKLRRVLFTGPSSMVTVSMRGSLHTVDLLSPRFVLCLLEHSFY